VGEHIPSKSSRADENNSLWAIDGAPRGTRLENNLEVDVAVIGAGYTGLSSAFHIKKLMPEREIVVLEAEEVGHGASGRNGGMCLTQPGPEYMAMNHPDTHKLTYDMTAQCVREVADLMRKHGFGSGVRLSGSLLTNLCERGAKKSRAYASKAESIGIPVKYWDGPTVSREIGAVGYAAGLYDPNAAEVNPMKMALALRRALERMGVSVYESSPVLEVREGRIMHMRVGGPDGRLKRVASKAVVLGTDAYTSRLGLFMNRLIVAHTEMAATSPLGEETFEKIGWVRRIPFHDDRIFLYHFGTTEDNRITIGAGNAEYFYGDGLQYKKDLDLRRTALCKELVRVFPGLNGVKFEYLWTGPLSLTTDMSPSVGVTGEYGNIYYGLGYAGHGVCLAYLFGKVIADQYTGCGEKWKGMPFYKKPFGYIPPEPFKYLVVKSYLSYLRFLDRWRNRG